MAGVDRFESYLVENLENRFSHVVAYITSRKHAYIVFDPLKPHFYIVKLGFTEVYIIFLISAQNIDCGHVAEAVLTSTHNLCFEQKYEI